MQACSNPNLQSADHADDEGPGRSTGWNLKRINSLAQERRKYSKTIIREPGTEPLQTKDNTPNTEQQEQNFVTPVKTTLVNTQEETKQNTVDKFSLEKQNSALHATTKFYTSLIKEIAEQKIKKMRKEKLSERKGKQQ